jgi:hypothetical protein
MADYPVTFEAPEVTISELIILHGMTTSSVAEEDHRRVLRIIAYSV